MPEQVRDGLDVHAALKPAAIISAYSILSLLHYRGLVDSDFNREDVKTGLEKLQPFAENGWRRVMADH